MQTYSLPYGHTKLSIALPDTLDVTVLEPTPVPATADPITILQTALDTPLGEVALSNLIHAAGGEYQVAIALNDKTRPVPHHLILPPLLQHLAALGVPATAITLIIATGTHIPTPAEEFSQVVPPDVLARHRVISHDCDVDDLVNCGTTSRGTPVWLNRAFAEADVRIVVGNIEPHHFAGFSGGVKSAAIGLAGRATATANHRYLTDARATLARYDDNPLRQDIEDIGRLVDVHFAFNVVMNRHKKIVAAFAGHPLSVMQAAIPFVRRIYEVPVAKPFDVLITSPGGYPKGKSMPSPATTRCWRLLSANRSNLARIKPFSLPGKRPSYRGFGSCRRLCPMMSSGCCSILPRWNKRSLRRLPPCRRGRGWASSRMLMQQSRFCPRIKIRYGG